MAPATSLNPLWPEYGLKSVYHALWMKLRPRPPRICPLSLEAFHWPCSQPGSASCGHTHAEWSGTINWGNHFYSRTKRVICQSGFGLWWNDFKRKKETRAEISRPCNSPFHTPGWSSWFSLNRCLRHGHWGDKITSSTVMPHLPKCWESERRKGNGREGSQDQACKH